MYCSNVSIGNNKPYERLQSRGIKLIIQKLGNEIVEEKVHPHKFIRTQATKVIDKGMPIEQVQHLLGHTKIDTTLHYTFDIKIMLKYLIENIYMLTYKKTYRKTYKIIDYNTIK